MLIYHPHIPDLVDKLIGTLNDGKEIKQNYLRMLLSSTSNLGS